MTVEQAIAFAKMIDGESYEQLSSGETRQAGYQLAKRFEKALLGDDPAVRLFGVGGHELTEHGLKLRDAVAGFVNAYHELKSRADEIAGTEAVSVGCMPSALPLVEKAWREWVDDPGSEGATRLLRLRDVGDRHRTDVGAGLIDDVRNRVVDVAVVPGVPAKQNGLTISHSYDWDLVVVTARGSPLAKHRTITVDQLRAAEVPIAMSPRGHRSRAILDHHASGLEPWFETESVDALIYMATVNRCAAVIPNDSLPFVMKISEQLAITPLMGPDGKPLGASNSIVSLGDPGEVVGSFLGHLAAAAGEM